MATNGNVRGMDHTSAGVDIDGGRVREARKLAGMSTADLAARARISRPYLSQIECHNRRVSAPVFARVCDALGVEDRSQLARERLRPLSTPAQRARPEAATRIEAAA